MTPRDWDAATYDRIGTPMTRWGLAVLERLELRGDECVLDAGCGTGRITESLLARLPRGRVVALDASPSMLQEARARLGDERVDYVHADLGDPLPIDAVDAVFSAATFHWVPNHDALFRNLAAVLRPGGQLVAQCGGAGNIESIRTVLRATGDGWEGPTYFADPAETARRLAAAGFVEISTWLHEEPTPMEPGEPLEAYLRTICLGAHLERMAPEEREPFVRAVAQGMPRPEIDYVRLNILARRPA